MKDELVSLKPDDYLNKGYDFWKDYRMALYIIIMQDESKEKLEKTPENIYMLAKRDGVKPTARYFNMVPSSVRYYIKKFEGKK